MIRICPLPCFLGNQRGLLSPPFLLVPYPYDPYVFSKIMAEPFSPRPGSHQNHVIMPSWILSRHTFASLFATPSKFILAVRGKPNGTCPLGASWKRVVPGVPSKPHSACCPCGSLSADPGECSGGCCYRGHQLVGAHGF